MVGIQSAPTLHERLGFGLSNESTLVAVLVKFKSTCLY